jgi:hypothetical protein
MDTLIRRLQIACKFCEKALQHELYLKKHS